MTGIDRSMLLHAYATIRNHCKCAPCKHMIAATLRSFEIRANKGDNIAATAALTLITAHYPPLLNAFYRGNSSWLN